MIERPRRGLTTLFSVSLTLGLVAVLVGASPVSAGGAGGEFEVSPVSGPTGTQVELQGTGCTGPATEPTVIYSLEGSGTADPAVSGSTAADPSTGAWMASFAVPPELAPGFYMVTARCVAGSSDIFDYPSRAFEVAPSDGPAFAASVEPDHGVPGDVVTVSGTGCAPGRGDSAPVRFGPTDPDTFFDPGGSNDAVFPVREGAFSGQVTVPDGDPGPHTLLVFCVSEGGSALAGTVVLPFEFDPVSGPTGPSDMPAAPTTPTDGTGTTTTATPATPVAAQPSFTG